MTQPKRRSSGFSIGAQLMVLLALVIASSVAVAGLVAYRAARHAMFDRALRSLDALSATGAAVVTALATRPGEEASPAALGSAVTHLSDDFDLAQSGELLLYQRRGQDIVRIDAGTSTPHPGVLRLVRSSSVRGKVMLEEPTAFAAFRYVPVCECVVVATVAASELVMPLRTLRREVAVLGLALAVLGIGFAYLASRRMVRRFRRLRRGVDRISGGDLGHRIDLGGNDELTELGAAVDSLAGQLDRDIEERVHSQRSLVEREQQYRRLFEDSRDAILITRPSGAIIDANQAMLDLLGYSRKKLLALPARDMYASPDDWDRFRDEIGKRDSLRDFEVRFRTKDGSVLDCLITATAQRDREGELDSYQSIIRDITKQKLSEKLLTNYNQDLERRVAERTQELSRTLENLRTAQAQLVEAEKMAALGVLVAGVAHEINTPIGIGVTAASTLAEKTSTLATAFADGSIRRSDFARYVDVARQSTEILLSNLQRAAELISSFKRVAVDQSSEQRRAFAIQGYLQDVLLSLRPHLKRARHTIDIRCDGSLIIEGYPGAFSQIVTNLVMNSLIHAFGPDDEGQIVFDIRRVTDDSGASHIVLEYADNGVGIPEENLGHVFEPFFSTKRGQGGSGLGMHIVYNLVTQRLGGTIRCESEVGKGTRFIIEMPTVSHPPRRSLSDPNRRSGGA